MVEFHKYGIRHRALLPNSGKEKPPRLGGSSLKKVYCDYASTSSISF
jgi:hypothetical protein